MDAVPHSPDRVPDEALYDAYLDAALSGRVPDLDGFLAAHPAASPVLRARLVELDRALAGASAASRPSEPSVAPPSSEPSFPAGDLPFPRLGDFRLVRRLDEGGMGTVYLAEQESLARVVALKVVRADLRGSATAEERFRREALAVARLRHENVVAVHAIGEDRGVRWIAMEYVPGRGLDEILEEGRRSGAARGIPASDAVRWGARIARALEAAHEAGIVHRDVKPSNVRITSEGKPLLLDFGIARELGADGLTGSAPFVGSPQYAAPEQIAGDAGAADARTDVYSLGVTLYQCLTGRTPWRGGTVEQVFREILAEDPPRLRRLDPTLSRDLELVVAKAMEKEPARRYASALEFARDLEALLEFRPVKARAPTLAGRLSKWARRRPASAAAAATVAAATVALGVLLALQDVAAAGSRRDEARSGLVAAKTKIETYRKRRAASLELERRVDEMRLLETSHYREADQDRLLEAEEDSVASFRREREALFHEVLDAVRRAESLDPDVGGAESVRAELFLERWREATEQGDPAAAAYYRARLVASDPGGTFAAEVAEDGTLAVSSEPPGAEVHVFRYVEQSDLVPGGDKRLVPAPLDGPGTPPAGTVVLGVTRDAGALRRGDLVVSAGGRRIAELTRAQVRELVALGGADAEVVRDGTAFDAVLPKGLVARLTAAAVAPGPATRAGTTPLPELRLEPGSYLVLLRRGGFEDVRLPVRVRRSPASAVSARLLPAGSTPEGFVRVGSEFLWLMEREVTAGEYLEFLNDDATLREIAASPAPIRFPRAPETSAKGGAWTRDADGRYSLAPPWEPDWPVMGVSLDDAFAYAAFRTGRARAGGSDVEYAVPTHDEWTLAAQGTGDRTFVYGNRFRPKWAKSCFARRQASPEPVLSYPIDESPAGAFDMSGGALEWCDSWYDEGRRLHRLAGGSWARAGGWELKIWSAMGGARDFANGETGLRLAIRGTPR